MAVRWWIGNRQKGSLLKLTETGLCFNEAEKIKRFRFAFEAAAIAFICEEWLMCVQFTTETTGKPLEKRFLSGIELCIIWRCFIRMIRMISCGGNQYRDLTEPGVLEVLPTVLVLFLTTFHRFWFFAVLHLDFLCNYLTWPETIFHINGEKFFEIWISFSRMKRANDEVNTEKWGA